MDQRKKELVNAYKQKPLEGGVYVIRNVKNGKYRLYAQMNPTGSKNRFDFAKATNTAVGIESGEMQKDWQQFGADAFEFEMLEVIVQKETQTAEELKGDLQVMHELWAEKFDPALSY